LDSQTKWVADVILQKAIAQQVNPFICIYRPGTIGSCTDCGYSNTRDFSNRFMTAMIGLGAYPDSDEILGKI
jgi:thioester reductase-like protein